jgi:hypothetical protein
VTSNEPFLLVCATMGTPSMCGRISKEAFPL